MVFVPVWSTKEFIIFLEHISPSSDQFESVVSSPRCESSLICYETSLVSSNTTPVSDEQISFEKDFTVEDSSAVNVKKIAKVSPMTSDCSYAVSSNKSINELSVPITSPDTIESAPNDLTPTITTTSTTTAVDENDTLMSCHLIRTNLPLGSSKSVDDRVITREVDVDQPRLIVAPLADQEIIAGSCSISPSSTMSSVYTLNLFDEEGRKSAASIDYDDQRTSCLSSDEFASFDDAATKNDNKDVVIDSEIDSIGPECGRDSLTAKVLYKDSTSLIEFDKSERSNVTLDPEVCTLLSSVENLPALSDAYAKKFNSFEEANALLQSFESLDQIGCENGRRENLVIEEEDDDDDDELLISLYENVEDEPKKLKSSKENVTVRDPLRSNIVLNESVNSSRRFENEKTMFIQHDSSAAFLARNVKRKEKFTESDEETQSRKANLRNDEYASTDSSSTRSVGLKIADAIAMFEKTKGTKSNSSSRESSLGRSDSRSIAAALASSSSSSAQISRRPAGFVLVRTPSSYESADENELANSPLFRKQQNLLTDGNFVVDEMDPLAVVEGHHRALTASSTSINRAGSVTSLRQTPSTTTISGNNNLQLYFV